MFKQIRTKKSKLLSHEKKICQYWQIMVVRGNWNTWQPEIIFLLIWKTSIFHQCGGSNLVVVCNLINAICSVAFNVVKWVVADVVWTLWFCFHGVTHDWISSVFEVLFLFWLVIMFLLSSIGDIDVRFEWLADDVWESEDDKSAFFSFGVDSFDQLFL